jgi:hypothetical protein
MNQDIEYLLEEASEIGRVRADCPDCGSSNTFSAMYLPDTMVVIYNCFDANCEVKGSKKVGLQKSTLKNGLFTKPQDCPMAIQDEISLSNFSSLQDNSKAIEYLQKVQCYDLYEQEHIVGRTLRLCGKPKWFKYAKTSADFKIGCGNIAVLVEDIPSACVVSKLHDVVGIALCGTILSELLLHHLIKAQYNKIFICLDKDAVLKSMQMCDILKYRVNNVGVLFPEVDLKNMNEEELEDLLWKT